MRTLFNVQQHGVNLIELMIVIVLLSTGILTLFPYFVQTAQTVTVNETLQSGAQLARECIEHTIVQRRYASNYVSIDNTICDVLPAIPGFVRTVTVTTTDNSVYPVCPVGISCKKVDVTVKKNNSTAVSLGAFFVEY
ncbi:MAG: prepilin-type N-terminal cleavage/methylation domain-containing protein [Gammaproteobacteria bacterium]|nr:prepilin-type N-terminal cleavage/methylation domain-containing protein [Gammaproteobacteria bacterium]MDH5728274.1 prepilin-type N-terminal cleavage/methylation domain-containing protein [Gammaproteobacteria bacterium]